VSGKILGPPCIRTADVFRKRKAIDKKQSSQWMETILHLGAYHELWRPAPDNYRPPDVLPQSTANSDGLARVSEGSNI